ncbi:MAG: hypothetical protein WAT76_09490, partial [Dokdonella sp.]|uniref:hypothetical protein n=1 Tax=Dokdonella sp. TaxID=2291710 RepID=UPI003BAF575C
MNSHIFLCSTVPAPGLDSGGFGWFDSYARSLRRIIFFTRLRRTGGFFTPLCGAASLPFFTRLPASESL